MKIMFDGDNNAPEIQVILNSRELGGFIDALKEPIRELVILGDGDCNEYYPFPLKQLSCLYTDNNNFEGLILLSFENMNLVIKGDRLGLSKLGDSLRNCFEEPISKGQHLHLDYFEGNLLIGPTNCSLIVEIDP